MSASSAPAPASSPPCCISRSSRPTDPRRAATTSRAAALALALAAGLALAAPAAADPKAEALARWRALDSEMARLVEQGRLDAAESYARSAVLATKALAPADPRRVTALYNLATILAGKGRLAAAAEPLRESLTLRRAIAGNDDPLVARALRELAAIELRIDEPATAALLLREADRLHGAMAKVPERDRRELRLQLAEALLLSGQPAEAVPVLEELARADPSERVARMWFHAAELLAAAGEPAAAHEALDWGLALLDPQGEAVTAELLPYLNARAALAQELGDGEAALATLARATAIVDALGLSDAEAVTTLRNHAYVLAARGAITEALTRLDRADALAMAQIEARGVPAETLLEN